MTTLDLRLVAGVAVVPPVAVGIALVVYQALWWTGLMPHGAPLDSLDTAASLGLGIGILALFMTLIAAVPTAIWLTVRGPLTVRTLLILGAVLGNLPFVLIVIGVTITQVANGVLLLDIGRYWYGVEGAVIRIVMGAACGMGSAAAFWLVAVRGTSRDGNSTRA